MPPPPPFVVLAIPGGPGATIATWLLTYWVHGALAAAAALAAGRWLLRAPAARDPLWKAALLVPLASATLAVATPSSRPAPLLLGRGVRALLPAWPGGATRVLRVVSVRDGRRVERVTVHDPLAATLSGGVLLVAAAGGGLGLLGVARRRRALARAIRGRRRVDVVDATDRATADPTLGDATRSRRGDEQHIAAPSTDAPPSGLVLSEAAALAAPVALGAREVCVPPAFWALTPRQRRGVLLHECAHLARRDPLWIAVAELVAAAAVQPLARLVVERLRRDAEFICDETAVRRTRDARALVESLAALARPFDPLAGPAPLVPGYLDSPLAARARRVLAVDLADGAPRGGRRALTWGAIATLALGLAAAPAVSSKTSVAPGARIAHQQGVRRVEVVRIGARVVHRAR